MNLPMHFTRNILKATVIPKLNNTTALEHHSVAHNCMSYRKKQK